MEKLTITVLYDPSRLSQAQLTDSLNENFHWLGQELGGNSDEDTGGYDILDWEYSPLSSLVREDSE